MTQKDCFIKMFEVMWNECGMQKMIDLLNSDTVDTGMIYFQNLKEQKEHTELTENGKKILAYLQTVPDEEARKSKEIATELFMSSRSVSGAMRKLVTDGFVIKYATNPISYAASQKGKEFKI